MENQISSAVNQDPDQISENSGVQVDVEQLQDELNKAIANAEENLSGWKRAQADFENYQKRKEAESKEWIAFGKQAGFVQLLPVLDSLEQAIIHAPEIRPGTVVDDKYANWKNGLLGITKQLDGVITQMNIEKMKTVGEKFDPNKHEALREVPGQEDGIIAEEYQSGYLFEGKVLRPAQVVITKKANS